MLLFVQFEVQDVKTRSRKPSMTRFSISYSFIDMSLISRYLYIRVFEDLGKDLGAGVGLGSASRVGVRVAQDIAQDNKRGRPTCSNGPLKVLLQDSSQEPWSKSPTKQQNNKTTKQQNNNDILIVFDCILQRFSIYIYKIYSNNSIRRLININLLH